MADTGTVIETDGFEFVEYTAPEKKAADNTPPTL